jgi:hypothetical protein
MSNLRNSRECVRPNLNLPKDTTSETWQSAPRRSDTAARPTTRRISSSSSRKVLLYSAGVAGSRPAVGQGAVSKTGTPSEPFGRKGKPSTFRIFFLSTMTNVTSQRAPEKQSKETSNSDLLPVARQYNGVPEIRSDGTTVPTKTGPRSKTTSGLTAGRSDVTVSKGVLQKSIRSTRRNSEAFLLLTEAATRHERSALAHLQRSEPRTSTPTHRQQLAPRILYLFAKPPRPRTESVPLRE